MSQTWEAKAAGDVVVRRWPVPVPDGDSLSSVSTSASGVTVDSDETDRNDAVVTLSAGTAGATASVTITASTTNGLSLSETFLLPIRATAAQITTTARDVVYFAMRKITGNGNDPEASEADDALERLNDMVALWRIDGLDFGLPVPLSLGDTLSLPDEYLAALKFNLRVSCHDHYDAPITQYDGMMAAETKRLIANRLFAPADLSIPNTIQGLAETWTIPLT